MMAALLIATTVAWITLEAASATEEPASPWSRAQAGALVTGLTLFSVHAAALVEHALRGTGGSPVGLALIAGGIALRIAAIRALGADFVSTPVAPSRVVTTGVYRFLCHPSELGLIAAAAGAAVLLDSRVAAGIALVVLVPLAVVRCAAEDRLLDRVRDRPRRPAV
jgi:protein-S-isoprenylcysteine O-methyltransferase Ste14